MNEKIPVAVCGALGRMGRRVIDAIHNSGNLTLVGAAERPDCPDLGTDVGLLTGLGPLGAPVTADFAQAAAKAKVYVDFTTPAAVMANLAAAQSLGVAAVIGTTGLDAPQRETLAKTAGKIPVLWSPNMSLGVNLMYKVAQLMAKSLGPDFDLEIIETHHRLKKDAPSGTALKLLEVLSAARDLDPAAAMVPGRNGLVGARTDNEIGVLAVRGGDIVGDHTILFAGPGERLELTHRAHSRDTFAAGAIRAAAWIAGQKPGLYSISDVLGL
ncbi:MAG: 4-hydroxy-tetrahydrodipicolinate reductase [Deltaproteobacteria bacterium]|jgi:4-hydroxy-tetrahydrodipicolinate reductase|nr:4-hydroxy-tetrahydrodipicolinate reductase [Deltaproteobacteria bacterium]